MEFLNSNLNKLFDSLDTPVLVLNNNNVEYINLKAFKAFSIQNYSYTQQDFFRFCQSLEIQLSPSLQYLKNGDHFCSTSNNNETFFWKVKPLIDESIQILMLVGSKSNYVNNSLPLDIESNQLDIAFLEKFTKKTMGSAAIKCDSIKEHVENLYQYLINIIYNLPCSVYWKDINGVYLGCNQGAVDLVSLSSADELIGKTDYDIAKLYNWPEGAVESVINLDQSVIKTKKALENIEEGPFKIKNKVALYLSNKIPLFDQYNNVIGLLGISTDITELKEAQAREREALEGISDANARVKAQNEIQNAILTFTGSMSHDLRTPLNTIQIVSTLIEKTLPPLVDVYNQFKASSKDIPLISQAQMELLKKSPKNLSDALEQADSYIDSNVKSVKGLAAGSALIKPEDLVSCSIEDIIRRVVMDFPFKEGESEKMHYSTKNAFIFMGNSVFMSRILQNLIKNSLEQINLKIKGEVFIFCENDNNFNYIKIKDTAGGVSDSALKHIFDGFNSTKKGGTGLGLTTAKQMMHSFNGDITCRLVDNDCIEFILSFPIPPSNQKYDP